MRSVEWLKSRAARVRRVGGPDPELDRAFPETHPDAPALVAKPDGSFDLAAELAKLPEGAPVLLALDALEVVPELTPAAIDAAERAVYVAGERRTSADPARALLAASLDALRGAELGERVRRFAAIGRAGDAHRRTVDDAALLRRRVLALEAKLAALEGSLSLRFGDLVFPRGAPPPKLTRRIRALGHAVRVRARPISAVGSVAEPRWIWAGVDVAFDGPALEVGEDDAPFERLLAGPVTPRALVLGVPLASAARFTGALQARGCVLLVDAGARWASATRSPTRRRGVEAHLLATADHVFVSPELAPELGLGEVVAPDAPRPAIYRARIDHLPLDPVRALGA